MSNNTRKGIILAAGLGTRLMPLTNTFSKHFLNIYNKPMIFYPLTTLMSLKIRDILIISDKENLSLYQKLLKNGRHLGIKISYKVQKKPNGIAEALIIGRKFLNGSACALILGDNLLFGKNITIPLRRANLSDYSSILTVNKENSEQFGVLSIFNNKLKIIEKPKKFISNKVVIGLYFFDKFAPSIVSNLNKSKRGELEITDLNNIYLKKKQMNVINLNKKTFWLDAGNFDDLFEANKIIMKYETKKFDIIGSPELEAFKNKWINKMKFKSITKKYKNQYGLMLKKKV